MAPPSKRTAAAAPAAPPLSTTAVAAIITGIVVVMLCLLGVLVFLLIRAVRTHKRLIADLDERGISLARARKEAGSDPVTRPRAVLKRNTMLPFNKTSGWGTLPSTETFRSAEPGVPEHYVPPIPANATKRSTHLSWPFSTRRRMRNQPVQSRKKRASRLSTVIESPNLSPMLLNATYLNASGQSAHASDHASRFSSCQSLLQHHPAFRHQHQVTGPAGAATRGLSDAKKRLHRAQSVVEVPTGQMPRPYLKTRSVSLCSQKSGIVPDIILPPLPTDMSSLKSLTKEYSQLHRVTSKQSVSSFGSVDSTVLASRTSPTVSPSAKFQGKKITKPNTKGSAFAGGKNIRDTLDLRTKVLNGRRSSETITPTKNTTTTDATQQEPPDERVTLMEELNIHLPVSIESEKLVSMNSTPPPSTTPTRMRNSSSKRKSRTQVSSSGSPERQDHNSSNSGMAADMRSPKRQHSQASSRSSGGNPFQWDQNPMLYSSGKPSNLKGSPSARKGHGRKNSVRISLVPTIHRSPIRAPSPSLYNQDSVTGTGTVGEVNGLSLNSENQRTLTAPPTSSTFSPDLKFNATSLRVASTLTSPMLPPIRQDQSFVVFPTDQILPPLSDTEQKRLSNGSMFSLSRFPATPCIRDPKAIVTTYHDSSSYNHQDFFGNWMPDTPFLQQHPFGVHTPERNRSPSPDSIIDIDEYDSEPKCLYQTPPNANVTSRTYQSTFAPIPEESSIGSNKTVDMECLRNTNSSSVSPKTASPPRISFQDRSAYNLPIHATCIPEEVSDTIDPAMLSKDNFDTATSGYTAIDDSIFGNHASGNRISISIPFLSQSSQSTRDPALEATISGNESPTMGHDMSELSISCYSRSPSPSPGGSPIQLPSPKFPCSPRPAHAQLPVQNLSINFAAVPTLHPHPRGPRNSPPRPLRSSIAQLRRMNSDVVGTKDTKAARGERRYLRIGREDSVPISGNKSWVEEVDDSSAVELDDDESQRITGNLLETELEWNEGFTVFDFEATEGHTVDSIETIRPRSRRGLPIVEENTSLVNIGNEQSTCGAAESNRSSSIWEDGEKFWTSSTPPPPPAAISSTRLRNSSSSYSNNSDRNYTTTLNSHTTLNSSPKTPTSKHHRRKPYFSIAKDPPSPSTHCSSNNEENSSSVSVSSPHSKFRAVSCKSGLAAGSPAHGTRKRKVLGAGSPNVSPRPGDHAEAGAREDIDADGDGNGSREGDEDVARVRIQITSPGGRVVGRSRSSSASSDGGQMVGLGLGLGGFYDGEGFLRV